MRKNKSFFMTFILLFIMIGICVYQIQVHNANNKKNNLTKTIAVSTIGPTHGWAKAVYYYAEEELVKIAADNNWNYIIREADDSNEQSRQIEELIQLKVDCIVLLPMDGASLKTAAIAVQSAGIPLVIFDREIPEFAPTATIKGDNWGIGAETAKLFNRLYPKGATVLELMGDTSTVPFLRTDGFDNTLNSQIHKIQVGYTEWQRGYTKELFQQWINKQDRETLMSIQAIFTHDDEIALGVRDVLEEYEKSGTLESIFPNLTCIAGSSGSQEMYHWILEENRWTIISMTYKPEMIRLAVDTGAAILKGEEYSEMKVIPTVMVDKTNVQSYIDDDNLFK